MSITNNFNNTLYVGTGGVKLQTPAQNLAAGDIFILNGSRELVRVAIGAAGLALVSTGTGLNYAAPAPGGSAGGDLLGSTYPNPVIANDVVTLAKLQNIATASILGRATAGTGDPEVLTGAQVRTLLNLGTAALTNTGTAAGNVPVLDASGLLDPATLPPLAITSVQVVANTAARLALANVQVGDIAKQTDNGLSYILTALPASTDANWTTIGDTAIDASDIQSGVIAPARLGTGTANGTTYLRGDGTWAAVASGSIPRVQVTGTAQQMANNTVYHAVNDATKVTFTLPATAAIGDVVEVVGVGVAGWVIAQNAAQQIRVLNTISTTGTGGRVDTGLPTIGVQNPQSCIALECVTANTLWIAKSLVGTVDVV